MGDASETERLPAGDERDKGEKTQICDHWIG